MTFSESSRAGDFIFDSSPVPPKLDLSGAKSQFYHSPKTPSAASSLCRSITPNQGSRKRTRYGFDDNDSPGGLENTGSRSDRGATWGDQSTLSLSGVASPSPLANTRYRFAGGVPESQRAASKLNSLSRHEDLDSSGIGPEVDYRPSRYQDYEQSDPSSRKRGRPSSSSSNTLSAGSTGVGTDPERNWGKTVINLVGDVAFKVWDFCWSTTFRGFYAGGGQGYNMAPGTSGAPDASKEGENPQTDKNQELFNEKHIGQQQPGLSRDELQSNWVLVKNTDQSPQESPPLSPRKTPRRGSIPYHASSARRAAARPIASAKRPSLATPTRSSPYRHQHSSSLGSKSDTKPKSAEAQRHVAKIRKQEREEDASIQRLNQQLKDMIRQGKEALGTQIEVDEMEFGDSD